MIIWILINRWSLFMWGAGWDNDNDDHNEDSLSIALFWFSRHQHPKKFQILINLLINHYRDIVEKPSPDGGGCDVLDMWPDLGASMKKWEWPESNGTDEKWKWPKHSGTNGNRWKKKLKTNFNWGELTGLYKTERMGQARYTRRDLDGAQGKPAASLRVLFRLQISKL